MSLARRFIALGAPLVLAATAASCTDNAPTALRSDAPRRAGTVARAAVTQGGDAGLANEKACTVGETVSATDVIGSKGGTIKFGPHRLTIPRGALTEDTEVTASATTLDGNELRVDLFPAGLQLNVPAELKVKTVHCDAADAAPTSRASESPSSIMLKSSSSSAGGTTRTITVMYFGGYIIAT